MVNDQKFEVVILPEIKEELKEFEKILSINVFHLQSWPKNMAKTAKNGVVLDTTSNVQPT